MKSALSFFSRAIFLSLTALTCLFFVSCGDAIETVLTQSGARGVVPNPVISVANGSYITSQNVSISSSLANAEIRYTIDGTEPRAGYGSVYQGVPIVVASSLLLKARAFKTGLKESDIVSANYTITGIVSAPSFGLSTGDYDYSSTRVATISCSDPYATIYYTTDNTAPSAGNGTVYTDPVPVLSSITLQAIAVREGWATSPIASAIYGIRGTVAPPYFSPSAGIHQGIQLVSILCNTSGVTLRYTTNGSDPNVNSTLYTDPIEVDRNLTIRSQAYREQWTSPLTPSEASFVIHYTVTWNSNGGSAIANSTGLVWGATISAPSPPSKTGNSLEGWYKDEALTDKWNFISDAIGGSRVLYAKWTPNKYNLTFNKNTTDGTTGAVPSPQNLDFGTSYTIPVATISRAGWLFVGWNTTPAGTGTSYAANSSFTVPASSTTLYAVWQQLYWVNEDFSPKVVDSAKDAAGNVVFLTAWGASKVSPGGTTLIRNIWPLIDGLSFKRVALDGLGNIYMVGNVNSTATNADFGNGVSFTSVSSSTGFLLKLNPSGVAQWVRHANISANPTSITAVAVFGSNIYVAANQANTSTYNGTQINGYGTVLLTYSDIGSLTSAIKKTSTGTVVNDLACDASGNLYAAGSQPGGSILWGNNVYVDGVGTNNNGIVVKFDATTLGTLWARSSTGGASANNSNFLALSIAGDVYVVGYRTGSGPLYWGGSDTESLGNSSSTSTGLVVRFNSSGTALFASSPIHANKNSRYTNIINGTSGDVFVVGYVSGAGLVNFRTSITATPGANTGNNGIVVRYNISNVAVWARIASSSNTPTEFGSVEVSSNNTLMVGGLQYYNGTVSYPSALSITTGPVPDHYIFFMVLSRATMLRFAY